MSRAKANRFERDALKTSMKRKVNGRTTQWAAQFLVASELVRRGYTVAFTMGNNTPVADLMVGTPNGKQFWIDVKGQSTKSAWLITRKDPWNHLFYVLVALAPLVDASNIRLPDTFFILSQMETNSLLDTYAANHPGDSGKLPGFGFKDPNMFKDAWHKLPI